MQPRDRFNFIATMAPMDKEKKMGPPIELPYGCFWSPKDGKKDETLEAVARSAAAEKSCLERSTFVPIAARLVDEAQAG